MSEEIRNPGAEMNDATLEGVSGGASTMYENYADNLCNSCPRSMRNCGSNPFCRHNGDLVKYMQANGILTAYSKCPYYNA